ncbi:MAG: helix-turn-helix domain-containing protein [Desulfitobacteriaceae bacterium]
MGIGRNIANYRELKRLTQEELASMVSVNKNYIARIERGTKQPSIRLLAVIAKVLDVTIYELLN